MNMLSFVLYKEFLELKSSKRAIPLLVLQTVGLGLISPFGAYLMIVGVMPWGYDGVVPGIEMAMKYQLEIFFPILLPAFMAILAAGLTISSIARETESRTLERILSLPLSWRNLFIGKLLFYFMVSLACGYIMVLVYFLASSAIVEEFQPRNFHILLLILVPAAVFYTVSAGLFVSAVARSVKMANIFGEVLTRGLFAVIFLVCWGMGVQVGRDLMLTLGFMLFAAGFLMALYTATRVNPEKLLHGS